MEIGYFTYITGLASLLGLILQIFNILPKYGELRKRIFLIVLGVFIGSFLRAFDTAHITFDVEFTGFVLLLTACGLLGTMFLVVAAFTNDGQRRSEFYGVSKALGAALLVLLYFANLAPEPKVVTEQKAKIMQQKATITFTEFIALASAAEGRGDFDRAIMHLESALDSLSANDPRKGALEERLREIKLKQVRSPSAASDEALTGLPAPAER